MLNFESSHCVPTCGDKGVHWGKTTRYKWDGMIMGTMRRWDSLRVFKNIVVFREDKVHVDMNGWGGSLNCLNDMELGNNARMTLF
jgi:hypothetical protein